MNLYEKYGGFETVSKLVEAFYEDVLDSDLLKDYFKGTPMTKLIGHQTDFLCKVLGGPDNYDGRSLVAAHKGLNITPEAFAEVARILQETLEDGGVEDEDVATILGVVGGTAHDIISKAA